MTFLSASERILSYISGFGVLQGILVSLLIYFHPKSDKKNNKFLAFYIAAISVIMLLPLAEQLVGWKIGFYLLPFTFIVNPLMFLYVLSFKQKIPECSHNTR